MVAASPLSIFWWLALKRAEIFRLKARHFAGAVENKWLKIAAINADGKQAMEIFALVREFTQQSASFN